MPTLAYLSGRFLPSGDATLSLADAGFVSGATVVDNARTFGGKLFRWADHLARFRRDCDRCFVPLAVTDDELTRIASELLAHNLPLTPLGDLHVVTAATPGPPGGPPTLVMTTYPIRVDRYRSFFTEGVTLVVAGTQPSGPTDLLSPTVKHRSRMHWHIAEQVVRYDHPNAVPVVLNNGVGDTPIGSIVAVDRGGMLYLPSSEFVQESISLKVIRELGLPSCEHHLSDYSFCSELLLCGTGFAVAGVRTFIDESMEWWVGQDYTWPGPVYQRLLAAWSDLVGVDIAKQFTG